ncbi:hypothetical protein TCAL_00012 [Tigriopus californicus]|uniref:Origin recognition complex subunit 3 n=1 Tax=Tigriopus californicus TaxID=6832 RepID=A0A553PFA9_TIGCA|nr:origin recognition complex subunit 3-like [Tigriopus californicus]TRY76364.1 hypothetical protein TCAL_00012 [Tigriopus californicus]|eukprot:TCALIF_00012-PA protein Name:"Similar to Orc3 Origin recognition complex subunit 3 (Mus musculus)" AED:0.02 eAED:0.02 QI:84/1/1/1/0.75/0.6/5/150/757
MPRVTSSGSSRGKRAKRLFSEAEDEPSPPPKEVHDTTPVASSSISKGVFAFPGPQRRQRLQAATSGQKQRKRARKATPSAQSQSSGSASPFERSWTTAWTRFQTWQSDMFADVLAALRAFIQDAHPLGQPLSSTMPTAAFLTGVNLPDHGALFGLLAREIRTRVTPHVASLSAQKHGGVNLKALVQSTVAKLMLIEACERDDEESEMEVGSSGLALKKQNLMMPTLRTWYANQYPVGESRVPLVIILEDFEAFSPTMLQDFMISLCEYATALPLVFVFGIATTVSMIHQRLPYHISRHLAIEKFSGQKSTQLLGKLVEALYSDPQVGCKLGGKTLDRLLEMFIMNDFSVKRFLLGFKYCMFEHFSRLPPPVIALCGGDEQGRKDHLNNLKSEDLDQIRYLASFRRYVESDPQNRARLLTNDGLFREEVIMLLGEIDGHFKRFQLCLRALFWLARDLHGRPFGSQIYSLYRCAFLKPVCQTHEYRDVFDILKLLNPSELMKKMEAHGECLIDSNDESIEKSSVECQRIISKLSAFLKHGVQNPEGSPTIHDKQKVTEPNDEKDIVVKSPKIKKLDRFELQKNLLKQTQEKRQRTVPFDDLRREVLDYFHNFFRAFSNLPTSLPLHEILFFDKVSLVHRHLMPAPRAVIQSALDDPGFYLEHPDLLVNTKAEIPNSYPDLNIIYKLHSECGRLINLFDWLQSWVSIADCDDEENCSDETIDPLQQAKFTQGVSSLQFLGFIKPSKRKTDHVARLTWGGC